MKKYLKAFGYTFSLMIILLLFITFINYIGWMDGLFFNILKIGVPITSIFIGGLVIGINSNKNGWLNGLKIGLSIILLFLVIMLILKENITFKVIIYYLIIIGMSIFGSMIGISKVNKS